MGNHSSRLLDETKEGEEAPRLLKGRRATKKISKITLFVIIGSSALFEVKRTQETLPVEVADAGKTAGDGTTPRKSDIQISVRQLPIDGSPIAEGER